MKKSIKFISSLFAAALFALAACDNTEKNPSSTNNGSDSGKTETPVVEPVEPVKKNFIVTFNTNGGSPVNSSTVKENETVAKPANPTKEGFVFDGWYVDSLLTTKMDFSKPITVDTTLYAKWNVDDVKAIYVVTFNTNGGSTIENARVEEGSKVTKPADPTKDGFTFDGWYTDSGLDNPMDFNTPITGKLDLYAKWKINSDVPPVKNEYTVNFETNGGSTIVSVTVEEGSKVTKPTDPTKDGYKFVNWYTDIGLSTEMNFDNAVTSTLTLYAKWEKVEDGNYGIVDRDFKIPCDVKFSTESHTSANQTTIDCSSLPSSGSYNQNFDAMSDASTINGIKVLKYRYNTNGGLNLFADNTYYSNTLYHGREGTIFNVEPIGGINKITVSYTATYSSSQNLGYAFTGDQIIKPNIRFGNDPSCADYVYFLDPTANTSTCNVNLSGYQYFSVCTGTYNLRLSTINVEYDNDTTSSPTYATTSGVGKVRINPTKYTYSLVPGESKITVPLETQYNESTNTYTVTKSKELTYYTLSYVQNHSECINDAAIIDPILIASYYTAFKKFPANFETKNNMYRVKDVFGDKARQVSTYDRTDGYVRAVPWQFQGKYHEFDIDIDNTYSSSRGSGRVVAWDSGWSATGYDDSPVCIYTDDHYSTFIEYLNNGTWSSRFNAEGYVAGIKYSAASTVSLTGFDPKMVEGTSGGGDIGGGGGGGTSQDDEDEEKLIDDSLFYANSAPVEMVNEYTAKYQQVTDRSGIKEGSAYAIGNKVIKELYENHIPFNIDDSNHSIVLEREEYYSEINQYYFELASEKTGYIYSLYKGNKTYIGYNSSKNKVTSDKTLFNFGFDAYGNFKMSNNGKYFQYNSAGSGNYRFYNYGSYTPIQLYRLCDVEGATAPEERYLEFDTILMTSLEGITQYSEFFLVSENSKQAIFSKGKFTIDSTTKELKVNERSILQAFVLEKHDFYDYYAIKHQGCYIEFYEGRPNNYNEDSYTVTYFDIQFDATTGKVKFIPMNLDMGAPTPYQNNGNLYYLTYIPEVKYFGFVNDESKVDTYLYKNDIPEPTLHTEFYGVSSTNMFYPGMDFILVDIVNEKCLTDYSDTTYKFDDFGRFDGEGDPSFYGMSFEKCTQDCEAYKIIVNTDTGTKYLCYNADTSELYLGDAPDYYLISFDEQYCATIEAAVYDSVTDSYVSISSEYENCVIAYDTVNEEFRLCKAGTNNQLVILIVNTYFE